MVWRSRSLGIVLIVALVLRICFAIAVYVVTGTLDAYHIADSWNYIRAAKSLINHASFFADGTPEILRTPGYPLLLTPGILLGHIEIVTVLIQCLLSCLTVYLVFLTSREIFRDDRIALFGAVLYAFEPLSILYVSILLTETLFAFLIMSFVYAFTVYMRTQKLGHLIGACLFLIGSIYVRPASYYLPVLISGFILLFGLLYRDHVCKLLGHALIFALLSVVILGAWQTRNYVQTGYWGFSSTAPYNLYFWMGSLIVAGKTGQTPDSIRNKWGEFSPEQYFIEHPSQREWSEYKILNWQQKQGTIFIKENLYDYFRLVLKGATYNLLGSGFETCRYLLRSKTNPFRPTKETGRELDLGASIFVQAINWMRSLPLMLLIIQVAFLKLLTITYLFTIPGVIYGFKTNITVTCFMILTTAYLILIPAAVGLWSSRYRMPTMPIICVFSGYGLLRFMRFFEEKKDRGFAC